MSMGGPGLLLVPAPGSELPSPCAPQDELRSFMRAHNIAFNGYRRVLLLRQLLLLLLHLPPASIPQPPRRPGLARVPQAPRRDAPARPARHVRRHGARHLARAGAARVAVGGGHPRQPTHVRGGGEGRGWGLAEASLSTRTRWAPRLPRSAPTPCMPCMPARSFNASHMRENLDAVTRVRLTHSEIAALGSAKQDTCAMDPQFYGACVGERGAGSAVPVAPHATLPLPAPSH